MASDGLKRLTHDKDQPVVEEVLRIFQLAETITNGRVVFSYFDQDDGQMKESIVGAKNIMSLREVAGSLLDYSGRYGKLRNLLGGNQ